MFVFRRLVSVSVCLLLLFPSSAANAVEPISSLRLSNIDSISIGQRPDVDARKGAQKILSDHPGSATALTATQKSEIRAFLRKTKSQKNLTCTGLGLTGQRESMYRVVKLRAKLVCDYAKSLDSALTTTIREKTTGNSNQNGRILISGS
jgi:hypothetical protein